MCISIEVRRDSHILVNCYNAVLIGAVIIPSYKITAFLRCCNQFKIIGCEAGNSSIFDRVDFLNDDIVNKEGILAVTLRAVFGVRPTEGMLSCIDIFRKGTIGRTTDTIDFSNASNGEESFITLAFAGNAIGE